MFEGSVPWAIVHVRGGKWSLEISLTHLHLAVHVIIELWLHAATLLSQSMNKYLKKTYDVTHQICLVLWT